MTSVAYKGLEAASRVREKMIIYFKEAGPPAPDIATERRNPVLPCRMRVRSEHTWGMNSPPRLRVYGRNIQ